MIATIHPYNITWELLPEDFILDDETVSNLYYPSIAAILTESLLLAGKLRSNVLVATYYAMCATLNGKMFVKAPAGGLCTANNFSTRKR